MKFKNNRQEIFGMKNMTSADYKMKRIIDSGYNIYTVNVPNPGKKKYIVAVKDDKSYFGTVAQVFKKLYGY